MPRIQYLTDGRTIEIGNETTLLRASLDHGIAHTHVCGGNAKCSTCRVLVTEGLVHCCPRNERESRLAGTALLISGSAWEQVRDAARCGRVLEVPIMGESGRYPLYEITALASAGA